MLLLAVISVLIVSVSVTSISAQSQFEIPAWVKGIAGFWAEDKITDSEFGEGLAFLIDNEIIKVPLIQELQNKIIQLEYENAELARHSSTPPTPPTPPDEAVIEEEGVLLIKDTQEYKTLIEEYGKDIVLVKATNLLEVEDTLFLRDIDDGFKQNPGCIIVLEYENNQGYVYQLDKELNIVYRMNLLEFTESANKVNSQIMEDFYKSLK